MSCDTSHEQLIAYLYDDDITPDKRERLDRHVQSCPACRKTLDELGSVSRILNAVPQETPNLNMVFMEDRQSIFQFNRIAHPYRWAAAAIAIAAALVLAFLDFDIGIRNGTFHASIGFRADESEQIAQTDTGRTEIRNIPVSREEFTAYQQDAFALTRALIQASESRQRDDINNSLISLIKELQHQRQTDLKRVSQDMRYIYETGQTRYLSLLETVSPKRGALPTIIPASKN